MSIDKNSVKFIEHRLALNKDGTVLAWGSNTYGQAGNGDWGFFTAPVKLGK